MATVGGLFLSGANLPWINYGRMGRAGGREGWERPWVPAAPAFFFSPPASLVLSGWDFGPCEWGRGYKPDEFERAFAELAARGATCVRLWVFGDGRAAPSFDPANRDRAVGLDPGFYDDFDNMLWRAGRHGLKVSGGGGWGWWGRSARAPTRHDTLPYHPLPHRSCPCCGISSP